MIDRALEYLQRKSLDGYELYVSQSSLFDVDSKNAKVDHFASFPLLGDGHSCSE